MTTGTESDYLKYRGKCKEMSEALVEADPSMVLRRGHCVCPWWGEQAHWWCERADGTIVDPTKDQFPSKGAGEYVVFDGRLSCSECGKDVAEKDAIVHGRYAFCSGGCSYRFCM